MHFPAIYWAYRMQSFDIFCPSDPTIAQIWVKLRLVKFYRYFSRYKIEKLIETLRSQAAKQPFLFWIE